MCGEIEALFTDHESYIKFCLKHAEQKLSPKDTIEEMKVKEKEINLYENIDCLEEPKKTCVLDEDCLSEDSIKDAHKCVLEGRFFAEHTAAGEATRLGLGTKYLLNLSKELPIDRIADIMTNERGSQVTNEEVLKKTGNVKPEELLDLSLGTRHMLQYSFDISKLAKEYGEDSDSVLKKQKMLVVLNEKTFDRIISEFDNYNFFGFERDNVFFMVQKSFHGINVKEGKFVYDTDAPKRLHNHGQMVMQQTIDHQIFRVDKNLEKIFLNADEFGDVLKEMDDKISYNIEDLEYLTGSIDYSSLAFALQKESEGYRMLMEIVANNPENPQKGGMAAFDNQLARNVMIEGFQLKGIKNEDIKFLNKNFNHFPKPYEAWKELKKKGLNMPVDIKDGNIYFQPVQGDINFLVKTEFMMRKVLKPIKAWKSPATTPLTIKYMKRQDEQEGFKEFAEKILGQKISTPK